MDRMDMPSWITIYPLAVCLDWPSAGEFDSTPPCLGYRAALLRYASGRPAYVPRIPQQVAMVEFVIHRCARPASKVWPPGHLP